MHIVIPASRKLRQEDIEGEPSQSYRAKIHRKRVYFPEQIQVTVLWYGSLRLNSLNFLRGTEIMLAHSRKENAVEEECSN